MDKDKKGKGNARNIETTFITTEFYNLQFSWFFWKAYHSNTKEWIHDSRPGCPQTHIHLFLDAGGQILRN